MKDIIIWRALSKLLTGSEDKIRSNRIPKKHQAALKELEDLYEYWKKRNNL
jgi:hypothetical protein